MDTNRLRLCVLAGRERRGTRSAPRYLANCNFSTSGVESLADDFDVRKGPVSSRVALLLRSAEGKPSFASISSVYPAPRAPSYRGLAGHESPPGFSLPRLGYPAHFALVIGNQISGLVIFFVFFFFFSPLLLLLLPPIFPLPAFSLIGRPAAGRKNQV
jgi:hypothetical protein